MSKHTAGPWKSVNHYICDDENLVIARVCGRNYDDLLNCKFDHLANIGVDETAALIAAAPELLNALELARDMIMVSFENIIDREKVDHLQRIKTAINRATGNQ